jgi:LuxR family transcriptional regulator, maltose regulon positive regulatory protein
VTSTDRLVVTTKLHIPRPPADRVSRPELLATLREAKHARLVLVSATAGAGKTTLLASWHADPEERRPFAWVSLDGQDNDPVRFWSCVLAALRTVAPGLGADVDAALRAPGVDLAGVTVPLVVNALAALGEPVVLALDDYHLIDNADVHRSLAFLLEHLPEAVQLALATRTDPPLPLARLRARGALAEVRAADLRLSEREAAACLNGSLGLDLSPDQIERLRIRTEGWAAGLQLVGLSLQGREDREAYIGSFAGDDRHIVDYVGVEVLDRQPPNVRRFLLRTAILERLCGELCDAVVGDRGSADILAALERANLFLVPLDSRREWYRYHHLFADVLVRELALEQPALAESLHRRASRWYRERGFVPDAIHHAMAAGDAAEAAELVAFNWLDYVNRGELETVEAWTRALPGGAAEADPRLCLARAWMLLVLGRLEEVEPAVQAAERGTLPGPFGDGSRSVESSAAMVRTSARVMLGDVAGACETAALAARLEPDPEAPWRPIVTNALGMTAYWSGRSDEAMTAFRETDEAGRRVANHTARIYALGYLAAIHAERRDAAAADAMASEAFALADRQQLSEHWVLIMAHYAAAQTARRRGDRDAARASAGRGLELARRGGLRLDTVYGLVLLARVTADTAEARRLRERAHAALAGCPSPGIMAARVQEAAPARAGGRTGDDLSERERAVLRLLATELSLREIGAELYVSLNTVKTHVRNIYAKLRVSSRAEAIDRARELGLVGRAPLSPVR